MDIEQENRFKTLIQPIRDLSLNWDIDIAEELGDYLEELDHLQITLDTGHSNLNFAEAALLIQGSAAVYSKKVEYLHQLVLNALELITFQKSTKAADGVAGVNSGQANQSGQKGVKAINMAFLEDERILFGSDPEYLLLDDVLEEGVNIALYIPKNSTKDPKLIRRHSLSGDLSKSSMILMHTILHVDNGSTSLRLSTCRMDANGALLIGIDPATSAATSEQPLEEISMIAKNNTSMYTVDSRVTFEEDERGRLSTDMPAAAFDDRFDSNHYDDDGGNDHYMPSYDDNIGRDDEEYAADDCAPASSDIPFQATNGANMNGSRQEARSTARTKYQHSVPAPARKVIPSPLDPHEANTGSKSCRKGHTYRVPSCLTKSKQQSSSTGKATAFDQFQRDPSTALLSGRIPLLGLVNAEFQDLAKEIRRSYRSEQFRKRLAAQKTPINDDDYLYKDPTEVFDDILVAEQANAYISDGHHEPEKYWEDEEDEDDGMPMYWHDGDDGLPMNDVDDLGDHVTSVLDKADIQALASFSKPKPLYSNPFAAVFEEEEELELARRVEDALNDSMSLGNTYESLCRRHIQDFMKGAEVYARETQLSRRVSDWTRRLEPVLRQQEESTAFDIFTYADTLLSKVSETVALPESTRTRRSVGSFGGHVAQPDADTADVSNIDHVVGIEEIAAGMNASEFSRMFLACLQLANSGNIDIITSADMNMTSSEHHHNQDADTLVRVPETYGREYIHPNFFGIHLLNANATFGLQMNLDYSTNEEIEVPKAKSSSSMRSKAAPVSSLSKAVQPQPTSTLE